MLLNLGINSLLISGETWLTRMEGKVLMQNIVVGYVQVKLGEPGWRERYYEEKFGARTPEQIEEICRDVVSFSRQYFFYSTFVVFGIPNFAWGLMCRGVETHSRVA